MPKFTKQLRQTIYSVYKKLKSLGYDNASIGGILGNALTESSFNPDSVSEDKLYHGLLLNSTLIKNEIIKHYGSYNLDTQLQYVDDWVNGKKHIKTNPHFTTYNGKYKKTGYKDAAEAGKAFTRLYERPVIIDKETKKITGYRKEDERILNSKLMALYITDNFENVSNKLTNADVKLKTEQPSYWQKHSIIKPIQLQQKTKRPVDQYITKPEPYIEGFLTPWDKPKISPRSTTPNKYNRAMYSTIDPRGSVPESYLEAAKLEALVLGKMLSGNVDRMSYVVGDTKGELVADAAWRKRLGFDYDHTLLQDYNNGVRLPIELENEIPTDTTMLKNRILATLKLMDYSSKYRNNKFIRLAKLVDEEALDALRYTYSTLKPVTINEHAFNSRLWVRDGNVKETMSPLNVLGNYTIRYNPETNSIDYNDVYDFNRYEWGVPGNPFNISGSVLLPKK